MNKINLEKFFQPKSIAVIGASANKEKIGYAVLANIIQAGFKGKIFPINLRDKKILGYQAYASILEVEVAVDLAVIVVPAVVAVEAVEQCAEKGVKNIVIITAGFKEVGGAGKKLEQKIIDIAKKFDIQIIGPNCLGLADAFHKVNVSFAKGGVTKGGVALISQSGAMISTVLDWAKSNQVGVAKFISLGNKAVVSENELLQYLMDDDMTTAVFAYLESIEDGQRFIDIVSRLTLKKPVIVLKPGVGESSKKAMQSHTGALTGDEVGTQLALVESGALRVKNVGEFFALIKYFSRFGGVSNNRVAVVTNAGGPGVVVTDELEVCGLRLANLSAQTKKALVQCIPQGGNIGNPVDLWGDAKADRYEQALQLVAQDKNVDAIMVILTPQTSTEVEKTAKVIISVMKQTTKPIVVSFVGGESVQKGRDLLNSSKVAHFDNLSEAVFVLHKAYEYTQGQTEAKRNLNIRETCRVQKDSASFSGVIQQLNFLESLNLVEKYGVNIVKTAVTCSVPEVVAVAERIGYPLVAKIFSTSLSHKTEVGGVKVGLKNCGEVKDYFEEMQVKLGDDFQGMVLQPMISGQEVIVGVKKDPYFGHIMLFGLGGIYTEILRDTAFALAPLDKEKALRMIHKVKGVKVLQGFRSQAGVDLDGLAEVLVSVSNLVYDHPEIQEIDLNPIIVNQDGYQAVDVRIICE